MKKHGVMLFTFVVLFLTLGCDLAYGQGEEGNEKEEVTVTLDFTELNYGLEGNEQKEVIENLNFSEKRKKKKKNNNENNSQSVQKKKKIKAEEIEVKLTGYKWNYIGTKK